MKRLINKIPFALFLAIIFAVGGATPAFAIGGLKMIADKVMPKLTMTAVYSSVDVSALAAYAGDYEQQLFSTMVNGLDIASDIRVMPNVKYKRNLTQLIATANAKPFNITEEYQGNLAYAPRVIEVKQGKVELLINLEEYRDTWMANQMGVGSHANKGAGDIPFAQYTWNELFKSLGAEVNDRTAYFGFDSSSTPVYDNANHPFSIGDRVYEDTAGVRHYYEATAATVSGENPAGTPAKWKNVDAEAIAKGFKEIIADELAASNGFSALNTGAVTTGAEALAAQKALFRSLPDAYKSMGVTIFQSYTDFELVQDGISSEVGKYTRADESGTLTLPNTGGKAVIKPATWMSGSRRLIATPSQNLIMATDLLSDMNEVKVLENANLWTIPVGIKFGVGFQIQDLGAIAVGDQA